MSGLGWDKKIDKDFWRNPTIYTSTALIFAFSYLLKIYPLFENQIINIISGIFFVLAIVWSAVVIITRIIKFK